MTLSFVMVTRPVVCDELPPSSLAAAVGDAKIDWEEVDQAAGGRLLAVRGQEYSIRRQALESLIAQRVLVQEARSRGLSVEELTRLQIDGKAEPVTAEATRAAYEKDAARYKGIPEADALRAAEATLRRQAIARRRAAFVSELKAKIGVRVYLEAPRLAVATDGNPSLGAADAPVTIVEFSDFQCPYCGRVEPTIKELRERYKDKLRVVFRDYPLSGHPLAPKAAEAANCAKEQGKFWEMHDQLFANQRALQVAELKKHAADIGLDAGGFGECLDSGKYAAKVRRDLEQGTSYGVTGTPTFFINGRFLSGAQPASAFEEIIDEELQRLGGAEAKAAAKSDVK